MASEGELGFDSHAPALSRESDELVVLTVEHVVERDARAEQAPHVRPSRVESP